MDHWASSQVLFENPVAQALGSGFTNIQSTLKMPKALNPELPNTRNPMGKTRNWISSLGFKLGLGQAFVNSGSLPIGPGFFSARRARSPRYLKPKNEIMSPIGLWPTRLDNWYHDTHEDRSPKNWAQPEEPKIQCQNTRNPRKSGPSFKIEKSIFQFWEFWKLEICDLQCDQFWAVEALVHSTTVTT